MAIEMLTYQMSRLGEEHGPQYIILIMHVCILFPGACPPRL